MDARVGDLLNKNIKDIISDFPEVQVKLDKYEIGCAPCNAGTCMLKDIVDIHNLGEQDEKLLLKDIFSIVYPGEVFEIPRVSTDKSSKSVSLSPSLRILVEEHRLIKRVLSMIPEINKDLDASRQDDADLVLQVADFIRNFADKFHHAKEEDILFTYFDDTLDIISVMLQDHTTGRGIVADILEGVEKKDTGSVKAGLSEYADLLKEHIKKEDEILYPWMERSLTTNQVGTLYSQFAHADKLMPDTQKKYESFVLDLEKRFLHA